MYDLRVAVDPATGEALATDCPAPEPLFFAFYALLLAAVAWRQALLAVALRRKFADLPAIEVKRRGLAGAVLAYMPTRVLMLDCFVSNPTLLAFPLTKLITLNALVVGTDPLVTYFLSFGILFQFLSFADFSVAQFRSLAQSRTMNPVTGNALARKYVGAMVGETLLYFVGIVVLPFVAVGLDHSKPAYENGEYAILIARCFVVAGMFVLRVINTRSIIGEVKALSKNVVPSSSGPAGNASPAKPANPNANANANAMSDEPHSSPNTQSEAVTRVLTYLSTQAHQLLVTAVVACVSYGSFGALPWLWAYHPIVICVIVSLAQHSNNEGLILLRAKRAGQGPSAPASPGMPGASGAMSPQGSARTPLIGTGGATPNKGNVRALSPAPPTPVGAAAPTQTNSSVKSTGAPSQFPGGGSQALTLGSVAVISSSALDSMALYHHDSDGGDDEFAVQSPVHS